jgi:hypothetical protein
MSAASAQKPKIEDKFLFSEKVEQPEALELDFDGHSQKSG